MVNTSFSTLGLSPEIQRAVAEKGYQDATPIQQQVIPTILQGKDLIAGAQTGTGKTAGFTLPMLHRLQQGAKAQGQRDVRTLILAPSRELAAQVGESVTTYGKYLPLRSTVVYGGVKIVPQIRKLRSGVDILVATPGRLLDLHRQGVLDLSHVEIFVLDEADRMLDMGFIHDIREIISLLPKKRQNLMFSATTSAEIKKLADSILVKPEKVQIAQQNTVSETITQIIHPVSQKQKRALLSYVIGSQNLQQVLVFTRTKYNADRLTAQLIEDGIKATAIHSNKNQGARTRALDAFKRGKFQVLVATDIASRGLDISLLSDVINYELPFVPEDYLHRIGRTGRAGNTGRAISLVSPDEIKLLKSIERLIKVTIPRVPVEGYDAGAAASEYQVSLSDVQRKGRGAPRAQRGYAKEGGEGRRGRGSRSGGSSDRERSYGGRSRDRERSYGGRSSDREDGKARGEKREYRDRDAPRRRRESGDDRSGPAFSGDRRRRERGEQDRGTPRASEFRGRKSESRSDADGGDRRRRYDDDKPRAGKRSEKFSYRDRDSRGAGVEAAAGRRRRDDKDGYRAKEVRGAAGEKPRAKRKSYEAEGYADAADKRRSSSRTSSRSDSRPSSRGDTKHSSPRKGADRTGKGADRVGKGVGRPRKETSRSSGASASSRSKPPRKTLSRKSQ